MAALDLHCGLEGGGRVWGGECVDLLDSFDSEMQEWEDQLQDMQRKIEELYREVKARREAGENSPNTNTNLDITLLPVDATTGCHANGYQNPSGHNSKISEVHQVRPCGGTGNGVLLPHTSSVEHPSGYSGGVGTNWHSNGYCHPKNARVNGGHDVTLDILNGYLGQGAGFIECHSNAGPSNLSSTGKTAVYCCQDRNEQWPVPGRTGYVPGDKSEEAENRKNLGQDEARVRHVSWKDPISSKEPSPEKLVNKPLMKQRESPSNPPSSWSAHFPEPPQQQDRKCTVLDRKCVSPSVLRKFGAMLQENEGKTLIENGIVTTVVPAESPKVSTTPVCQRKFGTSRASTRAPVQNCLWDADVLISSLEPVQQPRVAASPRHTPQSGEHRGFSAGTKASYPPPREEAGVTRKAPVPSPAKVAAQAMQWAPGTVDLQTDYRMVERILGVCTGSQYQLKDHHLDPYQGRHCRGYQTEAEQQYTPSQRNTPTPQQANNESSPRSFSRPARPANQRPPSRWASHTPTAKISAPTGPMLRSPSPARKPKQHIYNFNLYAETVIM